MGKKGEASGLISDSYVILCDKPVCGEVQHRILGSKIMALSGSHHVRALKSALHKAKKKWPKTRDRMELRIHTLKLRDWSKRHQDETILDLTYESIKSLPGSDIYELRIDDEIGGQRNIRVIFFVPPSEWKPLEKSPLPMIWVLESIVKKRNEWTRFDIDRFCALREVVKERFYEV